MITIPLFLFVFLILGLLYLFHVAMINGESNKGTRILKTILSYEDQTIQIISFYPIIGYRKRVYKIEDKEEFIKLFWDRQYWADNYLFRAAKRKGTLILNNRY